MVTCAEWRDLNESVTFRYPSLANSANQVLHFSMAALAAPSQVVLDLQLANVLDLD